MFLVFHDNLRLAVLRNFVLIKNNECTRAYGGLVWVGYISAQEPPFLNSCLFHNNRKWIVGFADKIIIQN